jgi:hypothetical protein
MRNWISALLVGVGVAALGFAGASQDAKQDPQAEPERKLGRIETLLTANPDKFGAVLKNAHALRVQVLLGEIVEGANGPELVQSGWRLEAEYFYPASAVKVVAAAAALERLNELKQQTAPALTERTPLAFHALFKGEALEAADATNVDGGVLTLEHLIRRALIVSDNAAYNRLYDFCGQQWLNERAWRAGLAQAKLSHRLAVARTQIDNKRTCAIELRFPDAPVLVDARWSNVGDLNVVGPKFVFVGKAHRDRAGLVEHPMSFFQKNYLRLQDLQLALVRIARPDLKLPGELKGEPFDLTDAQRKLLMDALSVYPGDSKNPVFERAKYPDEYAKFFLPGVARVLPKERFKIYNKVGLGFGFVVDGAYIVDTETNKGFFLAATMYANSDEVLNDDVYDYDTVAFPFFADLAEVVARDVWGKK